MFKFAQPEYLYLLLLIPALTLLYLLAISRRKRYLRQFGETKLVQRLTSHYSRGRSGLIFSLQMLVLVFLILAVARPQTGSKLEKIKRQGIDIVVALDVSNSMLAQDLQPNRLERAKQLINRLLTKLEDDRIGLVVFAGKSYIQMPITTDFSAARLYLSQVNPAMIPVQGTAIGAAIQSSLDCFAETKQSKAIIIITDGENHEDDALEVIKSATTKGVKIFTIGLGTEQGAPIPIYNGSNLIGYKKDESGNTIITQANEAMLKEIAATGNGIYIKSTNSTADVQKLINELDKLNKTEYSSVSFAEYDENFQPFLLAGAVVLMFSFFIKEKKEKDTFRINIFKNKKH